MQLLLLVGELDYKIMPIALDTVAIFEPSNTKRSGQFSGDTVSC
jgi:hypothetical protein